MNPVVYFDKNKKITALAFDELNSEKKQRWLLRSLFSTPLAFARNYIDNNWLALGEDPKCLPFTEKDTIIVGIATGKSSSNAKNLSSLQFIYLSNNQ